MRKLKLAGVIIGAVLAVLLIVLALFGNALTRYDPYTMSMPSQLAPPSSQHMFGADEMGRDVLARVLDGLRTNLESGFFAMLIALVAGIIVGGIGALFETVAGGFGRIINSTVIWYARLLSAGLGILTAFAIAYAGGGALSITVGTAIILMPGFIRIFGSVVLCIRRAKDALTAFGLLAAQIFLSMALAVMVSAGFGFLGMGVQPPAPELGSMISSGLQFIRNAPHLVVYPGLVLTVTALSFNILGECLNALLCTEKPAAGSAPEPEPVDSPEPVNKPEPDDEPESDNMPESVPGE